MASIGPLLMITAIVSTAALRKLSNAFLLNLAISDLFFVILSCPATLIQVNVTVGNLIVSLSTSELRTLSLFHAHVLSLLYSFFFSVRVLMSGNMGNIPIYFHFGAV